MKENYEYFTRHSRKISVYSSIAGLLSWDQNTLMPTEAIAIRAEQSSLLSEQLHTLATEPRFVDTVRELQQDSSLDDVQRANVRETWRTLEDVLLIPQEHVVALSAQTTTATSAWMKAKQEGDFSIFAPELEKLIALKKDEILYKQYKGHPYGALFKTFEPGITVEETDQLFGELVPGIRDVIRGLPSNDAPDNPFTREYAELDLLSFSRDIMGMMGFRFSAGRIDSSMHPFCMGLYPNDVRVTYHHAPGDASALIYGLIHETGHALYEQGLPIAHYGTPAGEYASLSVHESQSRFWENNICRSRAFWDMAAPKFNQVLKTDHPAFSFFHAANAITKTPVRIYADELHYHMHVYVRFRIEKEIFEDKISVNDIEKRWNELYKEWLGIDISDSRTGVLQDIHWSQGLFGYFPTYTIGSLMASQLYHTLCEQQDIDSQIRKGDLGHITQWLRENIHHYGKQFQAQELCERITGEKLNARYFLEYATTKFHTVYAE